MGPNVWDVLLILILSGALYLIVYLLGRPYIKEDKD